MKWQFLIFLFIQVWIQKTEAQCDSLFVNTEFNYVKADQINNEFDRQIYLSNGIKHFVKCQMYNEALKFQAAKIVSAQKDRSLIDQIYFTKQLDSLIAQTKDKISDISNIEYEYLSLSSWSQISFEQGYHLRGFVQLIQSDSIIGTDIEYQPLVIAKASTLKKIGVEYFIKNDFSITTEYLYRAISTGEKIEDLDSKLAMQTHGLGFLSELYLEIGDHQNAKLIIEEHITKAKILYKIDDIFFANLKTGYRRLSKWHKNYGSLDSALYYVEKVRSFSNKSNYSIIEADILDAEIMIEKEDKLQANFILLELINKNGGIETFQDSIGDSKYIDIADMFIELENYESAVKILEVVDAKLKKTWNKLRSQNWPFLILVTNFPSNYLLVNYRFLKAMNN